MSHDEARRERSAAWLALLVAAVAALAYALLHSRDFTVVDGAVRCVEVFYHPNLFFHENNHLLYPVDVLLWHRLLGLLGIGARDPVEYLVLTQGMNAVAAGLCLGILYFLLRTATTSHRTALFGVSLLGLSRAFLLHATNAAEPMVGLLWSLVGVLLAAEARRRSRPLLAFASGAFFALAMATYQSMILLAPAAVLLCAAGRPRGAYRALSALLAGGLCGAAATYGFAYSRTGAVGAGKMVRRFFSLGGAPGVFGGLSARKLALLPLGLVANLVKILPPDFLGFRSLLRLHSRDFTLPLLSLALAAVLCLSLLAAGRLWRGWGSLPAPARLAAISALAGLLAACLAPLIWEPLYDKLWLQPLVCLHALLALGLAAMPGPSAPLPRRAVPWLALAALASNLPRAVSDHRGPTPHLQEARQVAANVDDRDLVVLNWDKISVLYGTFWGGSPRRHRFDFPTLAIQLGGRAPEALRRQVAEALARGGRIYFLGILDPSPREWDAFLGGKTGLGYAVLDHYRDACTVARYPYEPDAGVTLRLWDSQLCAIRSRPVH
jgi:hypothetical protein